MLHRFTHTYFIPIFQTNMFHLYWPVIALVAAVTIVAIVLVLMLGGRLCGDRWVRTNALPDRPLKTYLPETVMPMMK
jgi:hypothetical protein